MLSDRERQELRELENQFQAEDPQFVDSFDTRTQRAGGRLFSVLAIAAIVPAAMVLALVLLVTDSGGLVLGLAVGAVLVWASWLSIKHSRDTRDGPHP